MVNDLLHNRIHEQKSMLVPKAQFTNEKNKKGIPLSPFRFSEEIKILTKIIYDALKSLNIEIKNKNKKILKEEFI